MRLGVAMESGSRPSLGQVILLGTSSMVTAVLYSIYRQKAQVAQELKVSAGVQPGLAGSSRRGAPGSHRAPDDAQPKGTPATCCFEAAPPLRSEAPGVILGALDVVAVL